MVCVSKEETEGGAVVESGHVTPTAFGSCPSLLTEPSLQFGPSSRRPSQHLPNQTEALPSTAASLLDFLRAPLRLHQATRCSLRFRLPKGAVFSAPKRCADASATPPFDERRPCLLMQLLLPLSADVACTVLPETRQIAVILPSLDDKASVRETCTQTAPLAVVVDIHFP